MASTYSSTLNLELQASGENSGTWGTITNNNLQKIESAIKGYVSVAIASTTDSLTATDGTTADEQSNAIIKLTGSLTGNTTMQCEAVENWYIVDNATTMGTYTLDFKPAGGTGLGSGKTLVAGSKHILYTDGSNMFDVLNDAGNITANGTLDVAGDVSFDGGNFKFNEASADVDFRIESNGATHMVFVDGGNNRVGINTASPSKTLEVTGTFKVSGDTDIDGGNFVFNQAGASVDFTIETNTLTHAMFVDGSADKIGFGMSAPTSAFVTIDQASSTGAIAVLTLDQGDTDQEFIRFDGEEASRSNKSLTTDTTVGALTGHIRINVKGTDFGYLIMPLTKLQIAPGIDKQNTEYGAEGKWVDCDNVRFRYGLPEKIGGWEKVTSDALVGATRAILTYSDLKGVKYAIYGTNKKLYAYSENSYADITPTRATGSITQFETVNTSSTVIVTDADHGALIGDFVTISSVSGAVGGLSQANLQGEFEILTVPSSSTYTIEAPASASSSATTGSGTATYQINTGAAVALFGYGWGAGTYGASTWNTSREGLTGADGVLLQSSKWALDNWGEDALALQFDGGLFYWDTSAGLSSNLASTTEVSGAPTKSRFMLVSGDDRHIICFGTETTIGTTSTQDNMFIRWSSQESTSDWTPTAVNTAGSKRLTDGNQIQTAVRSRGAVMVWTDSALYSMQFIGAPFTFGFKQIGSNCGAVGIHAAVDVSGTSFWMSDESFFMFDGSVKKIPCSVQDHVFDNINSNAKQDVFCAANSDFNEVMWFYPSSGSDQIDRVVIYNYAENLWYVGTLARSSWADSGVYPVPYAAEFEASDTTASISTINGLKAGRTFIYLHETGVNDDGSAMANHIESGDIDIADGDQFMSIARFVPDFKDQAGTVDMTMKTRPFPTTSQTTHGPFELSTSTNKQDTRIRGRQIAVRISSDGIDDKWRYGTLRLDMKPDGMRGG